MEFGELGLTRDLNQTRVVVQHRLVQPREGAIGLTKARTVMLLSSKFNPVQPDSILTGANVLRKWEVFGSVKNAVFIEKVIKNQPTQLSVNYPK